MELNVVPSFSVSVSPQIVVVPRRARRRGVVGRTGAARDGDQWCERARRDDRSLEDASRVESRRRRRRRSRSRARTRPITTRFTVAASPQSAVGEQLVTAEVGDADSAGKALSTVGYRTIEYPHIQRRQKIVPAVAHFKVIDVAVAPALSVGYIMGVGDQVPAALQPARRARQPDRQRRDGVGRPLEIQRHRHRRARLRRASRSARQQSPALEVRGERRNGNRSVQPHGVQSGAVRAVPGEDELGAHRRRERAGESSRSRRIRSSTCRTRSNDRDWSGWVQERGTYFLEQPLDPKYVDLIEMEDPFEFNKGVKRGALVEASMGRGAGSTSASACGGSCHRARTARIACFANLISLGRPDGDSAASRTGRETVRSSRQRTVKRSRAQQRAVR